MTFTKSNIAVADVFGVHTPKPITAAKFDNSRPGIPCGMDNFYFEPTLTTAICGFLDNPRGDALFIFGSTGCGKSETVRQICARLNYPLTEVTGSGTTEMADLLGHLTLDNGTMKFKEGPLTSALKKGHVFVLNEMDLMKSSELMLINDLLSSGQITIPDGDGDMTIKAHQDFRFIATGNSCGCGDENGNYIGVRVQNMAFMDRFRLVGASYMPLVEEVKIIKKEFPELPVNCVRVLCRTAKAIRRISDGFAGENMSMTVSTRSLKRWAGLCLDFAKMGDGEPVTSAMLQSFGHRATESERTAIKRIIEEEEARIKTGASDDEEEFKAFYDQKEIALINGASE